MSSFLQFDWLAGAWAERLGWTLVHFLWQGAAVALLLATALVVLRRRSANVRYAVSCAALLAMAALPVVTCAWLPADRTRRDGESVSVAGNAGPVVTPVMAGVFGPGIDLDVFSVDDSPVSEVGSLRSEAGLEVAAVPPVGSSAAEEAPASTHEASTFSAEELLARLTHLLQPWLPLLVAAWLIGVLFLSARLLGNWRQVHHLRRVDARPAAQWLLEELSRLAGRLGVSRSVRLLESSLVEVPTVIGWLRPVILLPLTATTGLGASQVEALLAHELAHIRRADGLVNLLQSVVETVLFYHPAVWWVSARIRQEREHCCDDLAAAVCGDRVGYAAALLRMEELRSLPRGVALAARGGHLLTRVRRLVGAKTPDRLSPWWASGALTLLIVGGLVGALAVNDRRVIAEDTKEATPGVDADASGELTCAAIADRIEETWKKFAAVEYEATVTESFDTTENADQPLLAVGSGTYLYRSDGRRFFVHDRRAEFKIGSRTTQPRDVVAGFDGTTHFHLARGAVTLGEDLGRAQELSPRTVFWKAGLDAVSLLAALRNAEAKIVGRERVNGVECVRIDSELKSNFDPQGRRFEIWIAPEQSFLPLQVDITRGGEFAAEWKIESAGRTPSGLYFPTEIRQRTPKTDLRPAIQVKVTRFTDRADFADAGFAIPPMTGLDVLDYRQGFAWHNDPWWSDLQPWLREKLNWPRPSTRGLEDLRSTCDPALEGKPAPELKVAEWVIGSDPGAWSRADRKVTVLYFFGPQPVSTAPKRLAALRALHERYHDGGLEILGVATQYYDADGVRQIISELAPPFPVAVDTYHRPDPSRPPPGARLWGETFAAYGQTSYVGTVLIDHRGMVRLVPASGAFRQETSPLEALVREELTAAGGAVDPPSHRREVANRLSMNLRGDPPTEEEIDAVLADASPDWPRLYADRLLAAVIERNPDTLLKGALDQIVNDAVSGEYRFLMTGPGLSIGLAAVKDEWLRLAAARTGQGVIAGSVQTVDPQVSNGDGQSTAPGGKCTIELTPMLKVLSSNTLGSYMVFPDLSRKQTVETDDAGRFEVGGLLKGSWRMTFSTPDQALVDRTVEVADDTARIDMQVALDQGDTISGIVVDEQGRPVANALVIATKRHVNPDEPESYTTASIPRKRRRTDEAGRFSYNKLYYGEYTFEITADGFSKGTVERIPAGRGDVRVVLTKPKGEGAAATGISKSTARAERFSRSGHPSVLRSLERFLHHSDSTHDPVGLMMEAL